MKVRLAVLATAVLCAAVLTSGSAASASEGKATSTDNAISLATIGSSVTAADKKKTVYEIKPDGECAVEGDMEGAFTKSQMPQYLQCIVPMVDAWIDTVYSGMSHPKHYIYIPNSFKKYASLNGGCAFNRDSAQYCSGDENVYLGWKITWKLYSEEGDASMAFALAHEVTHHFQDVAGVFQFVYDSYGSSKKNPRAYISTENQADCGGGVFMNYLNKLGEVNVQDDIGDMDKTLAYIASKESTTRDHGTNAERVNSFNLSWQSTMLQPMYACNAYYPNVPLIG